jgi:glycosyltransferase involved in cell wall biosynthesis
MNSAGPLLSVVVPLYNEVANVVPLVDAVTDALGPSDSWELILVDDGSTDGTATVADQIAAADGRVRLVRLARNYGQTPAMQAGFDHVRGSVVVSMDGDLQNEQGSTRDTIWWLVTARAEKTNWSPARYRHGSPTG